MGDGRCGGGLEAEEDARRDDWDGESAQGRSIHRDIAKQNRESLLQRMRNTRVPTRRYLQRKINFCRARTLEAGMISYDLQEKA
jgi:hypothetical protein